MFDTFECYSFDNGYFGMEADVEGLEDVNAPGLLMLAMHRSFVKNVRYAVEFPLTFWFDEVGHELYKR